MSFIAETVCISPSLSTNSDADENKEMFVGDASAYFAKLCAVYEGVAFVEVLVKEDTARGGEFSDMLSKSNMTVIVAQSGMSTAKMMVAMDAMQTLTEVIESTWRARDCDEDVSVSVSLGAWASGHRVAVVVVDCDWLRRLSDVLAPRRSATRGSVRI